MLYPRANEARAVLDLSGLWDFQLGDENGPGTSLTISGKTDRISVPASYNDQNEDPRYRGHYGWAYYRRTVTVPSCYRGQRLVLRFDAVTHQAKIYLNGTLIKEHRGGFLPFEADVTELLPAGSSGELTVAVDNRVDHSTLPVGNEGAVAFFGSDNPGVPSVEAAKVWAKPQNMPNFDFFNYAGINRPVRLYTTPKTYIKDVVLVPDPGYPIFEMGPMLCGAKTVRYPLLPENHYLPDLSAIDPAVAREAKMMVVSYPMNPVSVAAPQSFYEELVAFAQKYNIMILHDNAYSEIVFDGREGRSFLAIPGAKEVGVEFNSLSKTYSITGWRLGYLIGPADVVEGAKKVHDFLTVGAPAPLQEAAVVGLNFPQSYYDGLLALYTAKRQHFLEGLDKIGLKHNIPQGTYFVMVDIQDFLDLPRFAGYSDLEFCEWMIRNIKVAAVPGSSFFKEEVNNLIRLHFAREKETIDEAIRRLAKLGELLS